MKSRIAMMVGVMFAGGMTITGAGAAEGGAGSDSAILAPGLVAGHLAQARGLQPTVAGSTPDSPLSDTVSQVAAAKAALAGLREQAQAAEKEWANHAGLEALLSGAQEGDAVMRMRGNSTVQDAIKASLAAGPVRLDAVMILAAERNQDIQAAYENWHAAIRRFEQADYLQQVAGQYRSFTREIDTQVGPQPGKDEADLTFASPSVLALKGQMVNQDVAIARLQYLETVRRVLMEVAKEFFETQYHIRTVEIRKSNRVLVVQMQESAQAQLRAGRVSQADVLKTQVMLEMIDNQIMQESDHVVPHHIALLNALIDMPADTAWGGVQRIDLPAQLPAHAAMNTAAARNNQELQEAALEVTQLQTLLRMAETMVLPRASLGYSRIKPSTGAEAGPTRNEDTTYPERPMTEAPMGDFSANLAYLDELRVRVKEAEARHESLAKSVPADVMVKLHYLHLAEKTAETLDTVVPQSKQAFDLVKANYAAGNTPLVEFLDAGRAYFDNVLMQEEARMDLNMRWAELQAAIGSSVAPVLPAPAPAPAAAPMPAPMVAHEGPGHD